MSIEFTYNKEKRIAETLVKGSYGKIASNRKRGKNRTESECEGMVDLVRPFASEQQYEYANNHALFSRMRGILKTREIRIITVAFEYERGQSKTASNKT